jgi:hypothetical protein
MKIISFQPSPVSAGVYYLYGSNFFEPSIQSIYKSLLGRIGLKVFCEVNTRVNINPVKVKEEI